MVTVQIINKWPLIFFVLLSNFVLKGTMKLASASFSAGGVIPSKYTCDSSNISPELHWSNVPKGTKSFTLIVDDPDAPNKTWVHWIVFNIPQHITQLKENASTKRFATGTTDFGHTQYGGPCPPSGTHRYYFKLYALDSILDLSADATKEELIKAMNGHILEQTSLMGTYKKKS